MRFNIICIQFMYRPHIDYICPIPDVDHIWFEYSFFLHRDAKAFSEFPVTQNYLREVRTKRASLKSGGDSCARRKCRRLLLKIKGGTVD